MINFKDTKNKSALSTRWAQMSKQEQIIEKKKMEIQAKLQAQKQAAALAAQAKLSNPPVADEKGSPNIFSNDGSFMSQYKALLEKQSKEKQEKEAKEKKEIEESQKNNNDNKDTSETNPMQEESDTFDGFEQHNHNANERRPDRGNRDRHRRWNDRGRNRAHSPMTPVIEDRKKVTDTINIPPLMQLTVQPPDDQSPPPNSHNNRWDSRDGPSPNEEFDRESQQDNSHDQCPDSVPMGSGPMVSGPGPMGPGPMGFGPMGPGPLMPNSIGSGPMVGGPIGPGAMGPRSMGPGPMGPGPMGPGPMGSGPMGPGPMGPGPMRPGPMGPGPMGPGPMGSGPMGPGPMGPGPMGPGPMCPRNMGPGSNMPSGPNMGQGSNSGPNGGPMMGPRGPNMPPIPPFMGGPPNFPMPPNFMGPNGPGGPCGPGPMPPNMCRPNMRGPGPNGPMPPFFPFPNSQMPGPNGPPNSMNSPFGPNGPNFGPQPPFGPNGPNFGPNNNGPPIGGPPNMHFMQQNSLPPNSMNESKPLDNIPPPEPMKLQNIPPPLSMPLSHIPKPNDVEPGHLPAPPHSMQVLSADSFPPSVQRAAAEVATNGDHWENVLKAIHSQDQNMWFLHNTNSNEYKAYRDLVTKIRRENQGDRKPEIKPEDKYEPEFSLEDDDSSDNKYIKEEMKDNYDVYSNQYTSNVKREQTSSQSDDDSDPRKERRKRKKSRWGDDPPVDIKPPGVVTPLPNSLPGAKLSKIDEEGLKLTNVNRNNQALMQYAMTNYGTTNLSVEDWKKCEDNFKLNLLYQDMLKKRQEVERLAAAGKHKYEYDSDEDTSEGTWEHRLRAKEMNATERWATELTKQAAGKHHIGDFLPPEELKKFMEKYSAVKSGKEPDLSDYKEYKLKEDNVGFKMLQKLGWNEGQGLGAEGTGIVDPINKANQPVANLGLGASTSDVVSPEDDEFDAYRKRMMLAYRFRPNPLNNPRRPYY
ncbi:arginine-glutamic acid dipeptide repeats protein-like [Vanessa cardui]|uniref:arginine-glutamic acid dipeptide repeats protein-like n=1 Tax=Vanessa cardui TaxID=171605 RepID=UPI001F13181F|nr:arginine-glutamic acid dipeptide repeats protein-like [Vanessa cardui]